MISVEQQYQNEIDNLQEEIKELRVALQGIIDIGKRDLTNPKYDGYFVEAKRVLDKRD